MFAWIILAVFGLVVMVITVVTTVVAMAGVIAAYLAVITLPIYLVLQNVKVPLLSDLSIGELGCAVFLVLSLVRSHANAFRHTETELGKALKGLGCPDMVSPKTPRYLLHIIMASQPIIAFLIGLIDALVAVWPIWFAWNYLADRGLPALNVMQVGAILTCWYALMNRRVALSRSAMRELKRRKAKTEIAATASA